MICPKCGQELEDGSKFCFKCGTDVTSYRAPEANTDTPAAEEPSSACCAKCGAKMEAGTKFCAKCGSPAGAAPKAKVKINKKLLTICGCALAAIVVAVVLIAVLSGGSASGGASTPEAAAKAAFQSMLDGDAEALLNTYCTPILRKMSGMSEDDSREDMIKELLKDAADSDDWNDYAEFEEYGVEVSIKDAKAKTDPDGPSSYMLRYFTEAEKEAVEEYAEVKVTIEMSMLGISTTDDETISCVKMDGKWYVVE